MFILQWYCVNNKAVKVSKHANNKKKIKLN